MAKRTSELDNDAKWVRVRTVTDGWVVLNTDHVTSVMPCGKGYSLRLTSGQLILLLGREGQRVLKLFLPKRVSP